MTKAPGTVEGPPAVRQLLEEGLNINITLLFAQSVYEQVAEAFLSALESRAKKGQDSSHIASVAIFFVSRIDSLLDSQIDANLKTQTDANRRALLTSLQGQIATPEGGRHQERAGPAHSGPPRPRARGPA